MPFHGVKNIQAQHFLIWFLTRFQSETVEAFLIEAAFLGLAAAGSQDQFSPVNPPLILPILQGVQSKSSSRRRHPDTPGFFRRPCPLHVCFHYYLDGVRADGLHPFRDVLQPVLVLLEIYYG